MSQRFGGPPTTVTGIDVAANTEIADTVPTGEVWRLLSVTLVSVQAATQTPQVVLQISDGTNIFWQAYGATGAQQVNTTCTYCWAPGNTVQALVGATTAVKAMAPLPEDLILPAGCVIQTSTVGIGANTNYGAAIYRVVKGTA